LAFLADVLTADHRAVRPTRTADPVTDRLPLRTRDPAADRLLRLAAADDK